MSKDPAFLFYPNDWIGGTMGMSLEDKGAYMEILMMQFNVGHMTSHMIGQVVGQKWDNIKHKFRMDSEGKFFNERLELEKDKRKKFTKSRHNNISGNNQHKKTNNKLGHMDGHTTSHMENENENVNEDINTIIFKGKKYLESDFNGLPENYHQAIIEQFKIQKQKTITNDMINPMWKSFKLQTLTGMTYYNNEHEVYRHFTNWIKTQKFEDANTKLSATDKFNSYLTYADRFIEKRNESEAS